MDYNPRHVPTTLESVDIRRQYVAFYHHTWVPNIIRPLLVIFNAKTKGLVEKDLVFKSRW